MNTKLLNITRYGLAAGLLVGTLALGGASAASASVSRPCPGGTCGGHYGSAAPVAASVARVVPRPCPGGTCGGKHTG